MSETEFIDSIDGCLLSGGEAVCRRAIEIASGISTNALAMVIYEIASSTNDAIDRDSLLDAIDEASATEIIAAATTVARKLIHDHSAEQEDVDRLLSLARSSPGSFNAVALAEAADPKRATACEEIRRSW